MQFQEWDRKNQFSGFNSWKGLLYSKWYEGIVKGKLLPPIEASLDPIHACNLRCDFCNAGKYLKGPGEHPMMDGDHMLAVVDFLAEWGVKAVCFGGGGEPTLHPMLANALERTYLNKMGAAVATNGVDINENLADSMLEHCSWVSVSVDAATRPTFTKIKGMDMLPRVLANIETLVKMSRGRIQKGYWDLCFRFLISTSNQNEVYEACRIAKDLGCTSFHARPVDYRHQGIQGDKMALGAFDASMILDKFAQCQELGDDNFKVFTVIHKFNSDMTPRRKFKQCWGAPLSIQICADGNCYFCVDQRFNTDYILGQHYPKPSNMRRFWGKKRHLEMLYGDTPFFCKNRCTFTAYAEQCEKLFADGNDEVDPMCWRFP